jgi:hypothetical protein
MTLLAGATIAAAQSNVAVPHPGMFSLSPIQLRAEASNPKTHQTVTVGASESGFMEIGAESIIQSLDRYRWINEAECLTRTELHEPTPLDKIFAPEVIRLRKVHLSGSLITAIKRKNPLCLLNPIVFWMSW